MRKLFAHTVEALLFPFVNFYITIKWGGYWNMKKAFPNFYSKKALAMSWRYYFERKNSDISPSTYIVGIPCFPHGEFGVFISRNAVIGENAVIFQQVTIGSNTLKGSNCGSPIIGSNCYIGAGAKIVGNVVIGDNCRIGANACVYKDMPDNSVAVCSPTRIITKNTILDNRFFSVDGLVFDFETGKYVLSK